MIAAAMALGLQGGSTTNDISDNNWLDQYRIPVGNWFEQTADWIDENLGWLLDAIKWPFEFLFDLMMSPNPSRDSMMSISWLWLVLGFFFLGSFLRNTRVGLMAAAMVFLCGILGREEYDQGLLDGGFWFQTSKTFGMVFVAVVLCALVGLPLGVLCGRNDGVWNVTRPVLDAMQVVHSFVWMLPFVAFWGIGEVSATMVTMMFALPPLVRLTNLGVRQVPSDVVEASRAFGSSELRVLTDVQIPLARPAIMTGLNQTLLLAISMLGIAAIMGADGLGKLIYRAINNKDVALAFSAGLAFFFVAVVLDRVTQPEADDGLSLFGRIGQAWSARRNPESLLEGVDIAQLAAEETAQDAEPAERIVAVGATERLGLLTLIAGSIVAIVGTTMTWVKGGSLLSSWGAAADYELAGTSASGLADRGGSWFGITVVALCAAAILCALRPLVSPPAGLSQGLSKLQGVLLGGVALFLPMTIVLNAFDSHIELLERIALIALAAAVCVVGIETWVKGSRRMGADGALIAAIGSVSLPFAFLFAESPAEATQASIGIGVWVTLLGTAVAVAGGVIAVAAAPYVTTRPLKAGFSLAQVAGVGIAVALGWGAATAAWYVDERNGYRNREFYRGLTDDGPGLGWAMIWLVVAGAAAALLLIGSKSTGGKSRWPVGTLTAGLGVAIMAMPLAWSMVIADTGDANYFDDLRSVSGAAVLFGLCSGFVVFAMGRSAIADFRRQRIYADLVTNRPETGAPTTATATADELVGAAGGN